MKNNLIKIGLLVSLFSFVSCNNLNELYESIVNGEEEEKELVQIDGEVWSGDAQGGFDDFTSAGAALGFSVDDGSNMIMINAFKWNDTFYTGDFVPGDDAAYNANLYEWGKVNSLMTDNVNTYPLLEYALTNTAGIRTSLNEDFIGIILAGDLNESSPDKIYIATRGYATLTREDGPYDIAEGTLEYTEVELVGDSYQVKSESDKLQYKFYFQWSTQDQMW